MRATKRLRVRFGAVAILAAVVCIGYGWSFNAEYNQLRRFQSDGKVFVGRSVLTGYAKGPGDTYGGLPDYDLVYKDNGTQYVIPYEGDPHGDDVTLTVMPGSREHYIKQVVTQAVLSDKRRAALLGFEEIAGISIAVIFLISLPYFRERAILAHWPGTEATVTDLDRSSSGPSCFVVVRYYDEEGLSHEHIRGVIPSVFREIRERNKVFIYYNPRKPFRYRFMQEFLLAEVA